MIFLKLLWFNWRDIKNPDAGGAEVFTHEVMKRLQSYGYSSTLFTSSFDNASAEEIVDGVKIVRRGSKYSVYGEAKKYYESQDDNYDIVIDEINTRPFMTPKFVKNKPILALFHQMAKEFWFYETRFPLNYIGYYLLERRWLSLYKNIRTVTVSKSSKDDLEELGFKDLRIISEGIAISPLQQLSEKEPNPTIAFLGRLKKAKLPHHAIEAFAIIKKQVPDAKMWVIGDGYMREELEKMSVKDVTFYGKVDNETKYDLLKRAHLVMVPAVREGWGLVVTEANAMGTPAVAYNVHGLRDSIRDGETGILTKENTPEGLANLTITLLQNSDTLIQLSYSALKFSSNFSWDNTARQFDLILKSLVS